MIVIHGSSRALGFEYNSVLLNLQHALKVKSEYVKIMVLPAVRNFAFLSYAFNYSFTKTFLKHGMCHEQRFKLFLVSVIVQVMITFMAVWQ